MDEQMRKLLETLRDSMNSMLPESFKRATHRVQGATRAASVLLVQSDFDVDNAADVENVMRLLMAAAGSDDLAEMGESAEVLKTHAQEQFCEGFRQVKAQHEKHMAGECGCGTHMPQRERDERAPSVEETEERFGQYL
jgi:hypothetical protein